MSPIAEPISLRQAELLRAVCREYLLGGDEVASATLARRFDWSSATIRAELAVLERGGLIERPHRSAGARPTREGLDQYLLTLPLAPPPTPLTRVLDRTLAGPGEGKARGVRTTVAVLAEATGCVALSLVEGNDAPVVEAVEVAPSVGARALVALTLAGGACSVHPIAVENLGGGVLLQSNLLRLQQQLRQLCIGRTVDQARMELLRLQYEHEWQIDRVLAECIRVGLGVCALAGIDPAWVHVAGHWSLARLLGGLTAEQLAELSARLEDDRRLADVLCQLLPVCADEARVRAHVRLGGIGLLDGTAARPEDTIGGPRLAVVGCRWFGDRGLGSGLVALLGSDRMDYAAVIPLVEYAAQALVAQTCEL